jgi:nucleotide-binding universal stress UspA family protein
MKTIIAGVDFSKSSNNAANYAAMLAKKLNYKLVLFNMYDVPLIHTNNGLYFMSFESIRQSSETKLANQCKKLKKLFPKLEIGTFATTGAFQQELKEFIKSHQVKLVVMGLSSKDRFSKFIYGSHSTDIAGKVNSPVIIVPDNFKTHSAHKIVLSVDNKEKLHKSSLNTFENLTKEMKADVSLLHIQTEDEIFDSGQKDVLKINGKLKKIEKLSAHNIEKGIGSYTKLKKVDLITIISKKHSVFYNLFNESNTKRIAFNSKVPVMAIHE